MSAEQIIEQCEAIAGCMSDSTQHTPLAVQFGRADAADFEAGTWTFEMIGDYRVAAGDFAILPRSAFDALKAQRDELLRMLESVTDVYASVRKTMADLHPMDGWSAQTMTIDAARALIQKHKEASHG